MNRRNQKSKHSPPVQFRLKGDMYDRFERVVKASKRSKTSLVEECLEKFLPELEKQYEAAA